MPTLNERVQEQVQSAPGLTELEIAQAIFGPDGYQQQVNSTCRWLSQKGLVERRGHGGHRDPYRYFSVGHH
jgi:hypothetical protein